MKRKIIGNLLNIRLKKLTVNRNRNKSQADDSLSFSFVYSIFDFIARSQSSLSHASPALQASHNASTATRELDDLMASLSDFKVSSV